MNDLRTSGSICAETEPQPQLKTKERRKRKLVKRRKPLIEGQIYFARSGDVIKIGFSTDAESRVASLQTAHFEPLSLLATTAGTQRGERFLHYRFRHLRVRGEWFRAGPELIAYIDELNGVPVPDPVPEIIVRSKPSLPPGRAEQLTRIRGMVRRSPEGVQKQRLELLAAQLENGAPAAYLQRQLEVMASSHSQH